MYSSRQSCEGSPKRPASPWVALSIGVGPQANISTWPCSSWGSDLSQAWARSVTSPSKQPANPLRLESRLGIPQSSSSGMQAITPGGMPGTIICDGRGRNGNGTSDPISTRGFISSPIWRSRSARNTMGGMPTPPPIRSGRRRAAEGLKATPIGPSKLIVCPGGIRASSRVPSPTRL